MASKRDEVRLGVSQEPRVLKRWQQLSPRAEGAAHAIKGGEFDDFDRVVFGGDGLVLCYLEIKVRRSPLSKFGDALFPERKHVFALLSKQRQGIPFIGVTEYGCGALVEVDLAQKPAERRSIKRRDRPGPSVPHVLYSKDQLTVLSEGDD